VPPMPTACLSILKHLQSAVTYYLLLGTISRYQSVCTVNQNTLMKRNVAIDSAVRDGKPYRLSLPAPHERDQRLIHII